jgi:hypothetical protein
MRATQGLWSVTLCAICAIGLIGCEDRGKREAEQLVSAIDAYRRAPLDQVGEAVQRLESASCEASATCTAKDACLKSARPSREGMARLTEVKLAMRPDADLESLRPEDRAKLDAQMNDAERLLKEGKDALVGCDAEVLALRRRFALPPRAF